MELQQAQGQLGSAASDKFSVVVYKQAHQGDERRNLARHRLRLLKGHSPGALSIENQTEGVGAAGNSNTRILRPSDTADFDTRARQNRT
ncbi:hypothetical protein GCM10007052_11050 [Halioglobus japonicus]|nr:hypothetical protein GCM10007052_11050 [Halioglobus japonicus]